MLEVDNRVMLPEFTHVRFIKSSGDVIRSYACPALGIKCDAYPGRLNQVSVLVNRKGSFILDDVQIYVEYYTVQCLLLSNLSYLKYFFDDYRNNNFYILCIYILYRIITIIK